MIELLIAIILALCVGFVTFIIVGLFWALMIKLVSWLLA